MGVSLLCPGTAPEVWGHRDGPGVGNWQGWGWGMGFCFAGRQAEVRGLPAWTASPGVARPALGPLAVPVGLGDSPRCPRQGAPSLPTFPAHCWAGPCAPSCPGSAGSWPWARCWGWAWHSGVTRGPLVVPTVSPVLYRGGCAQPAPCPLLGVPPLWLTPHKPGGPGSLCALEHGARHQARGEQSCDADGPAALSLSRWRRDSFGDICYQNQASAPANVAVPACPAPRLGSVPRAGVAVVALLR